MITKGAGEKAKKGKAKQNSSDGMADGGILEILIYYRVYVGASDGIPPSPS